MMNPKLMKAVKAQLNNGVGSHVVLSVLKQGEDYVVTYQFTYTALGATMTDVRVAGFARMEDRSEYKCRFDMILSVRQKGSDRNA